MPEKSQLTLVAQPEDYFRELVVESLGKQQVKAQPETEVYLVHLLNRFMTTDNLYSIDEKGQRREEPLALMVKEALEQPTSEVQRLFFRQIGDVSLYVAGFFPESLSRKLVDVGYYIDMGEMAYKNVAARVDDSTQRTLYGELSYKFGAFVDVLAHISEKTSPMGESELLKVYEKWIETGNDRAERKLKQAGIEPAVALRGSRTKQ
jgi:hypothetical protein